MPFGNIFSKQTWEILTLIHMWICRRFQTEVALQEGSLGWHSREHPILSGWFAPKIHLWGCWHWWKPRIYHGGVLPPTLREIFDEISMIFVSHLVVVMVATQTSGMVQRLWCHPGILTRCNYGSCSMCRITEEWAATALCNFDFWLWQTYTWRWALLELELQKLPFCFNVHSDLLLVDVFEHFSRHNHAVGWYLKKATLGSGFSQSLDDCLRFCISWKSIANSKSSSMGRRWWAHSSLGEPTPCGSFPQSTTACTFRTVHTNDMESRCQ